MMIQAIIASAMMLQGAPADGQMQVQPVAMIEAQQDPAALINLGVELAQAGETEEGERVSSGGYTQPGDLGEAPGHEAGLSVSPVAPAANRLA